MNSDLIVMTCFSGGLISAALVARWYLWPWLRNASEGDAYTPLLLAHSYRFVGLLFLAPGAVQQALPQVFANTAAWGDVLSALLALVALAALRRGQIHAGAWLWTFNIVGTADLLVAVGLGVATGAAGAMGAAIWIPILIVPPLLVTHALIFMRLVTPMHR